MVNYINYANQGATRNQPLSEDLLKRLQYLQDMGLTAQVFSGGQDAEGPNRTGSHRHDHGGAADVFFYQGDRKLDWANPDDRPLFEQIVAKGKENGITGFGAGPGYMREGSMHLGMGAPAVWGAGGKSDTAPDWLKRAYNGTDTKSDPVSEVVAAAQDNPSNPENPLAAALKAKAEPTSDGSTSADAAKPDSHNGILVQAYNKLTGSDVQMPGTILGADTNKVMKGVSGIGDFAKSLMESDAELNKQIAANARSGGRSSAPVEIAFSPTMVLSQQQRKKRGALGGLGGYLI